MSPYMNNHSSAYVIENFQESHFLKTFRCINQSVRKYVWNYHIYLQFFHTSRSVVRWTAKRQQWKCCWTNKDRFL